MANSNSTVKVKHNDDETRATTDCMEGTEDNASLSVLETSEQARSETEGIKQECDDREHDGVNAISSTA